MKCSCGKEMKYVGFVRDDSGEIHHENYVCENEECPKLRDLQSFNIYKEGTA